MTLLLQPAGRGRWADQKGVLACPWGCQRLQRPPQRETALERLWGCQRLQRPAQRETTLAARTGLLLRLLAGRATTPLGAVAVAALPLLLVGRGRWR